MPEEKIVAIGLLTSHDLKMLGEGFTRHFPVPEGEAFVELIRQLDAIEWEPGTQPPRGQPRK
jgi:hypothetical protein